MKNPIATIALVSAAFMLTACGGESTTDELLPEGTAPNENQPADATDDPTEAGGDYSSDSGAYGSDNPAPAAPDPVAETPETTTPPPLPLPLPADDAERLTAPGISYVLPEGWAVGPARQMRLLTLLPPGDTGADFAISKWPSDVGGFPMNVNRWARQVGLPPIPGLMTAAASDFEQFKIDGNDATWIPLMNEQSGRAILAVWVPIGEDPENPDETWTLKLTCQADQVEALAPIIRAWCESIKFE